MAQEEKRMELKELFNQTLALFGCSKIESLGAALMKCVVGYDVSAYSSFSDMVGDLTVDWLQKIFQYHLADRREKKQDYTPGTLAAFMGLLCGESDTVVDLCAGSGALTIQKWAVSPHTSFVLYELDENVLPYLLFNMAVRNIRCTVHHADVLQDETYKTFLLEPGDQFATVTEVPA